jgi:hypothetical protein
MGTASSVGADRLAGPQVDPVLGTGDTMSREPGEGDGVVQEARGIAGIEQRYRHSPGSVADLEPPLDAGRAAAVAALSSEREPQLHAARAPEHK